VGTEGAAAPHDDRQKRYIVNQTPRECNGPRGAGKIGLGIEDRRREDKRCMKTFPLLIVLFIVASGLVDIVVWILFSEDTFSELAWFLTFGLALGQLGLLAAWLVISSTNIVLRVLMVVAGIGLLSIFAEQIDDSPALECSGYFFACTVTVAVPLLAARMTGMRLVNTHHENNSATSEFTLRRWQFSLRNMLLWTTSIAIVLGAMRWIDFSLVNPNNIVPYCVSFACVTYASLWSMLLVQNVFLRLTVLFVMCPFVGVALSVVAYDSTWTMAMITGIQGIYIAAGAAVFRLSGYRVMWAKKGAA